MKPGTSRGKGRLRRERRSRPILLVPLLAGVASLGLGAGCSEEDERTDAMLEPQVERPAAEPLATRPASERAAPAPPPGADAPTPAPGAEAVGPEEMAAAAASELELQPELTDWTGGNADEGGKLYTVYCLACHGAEGRGDGPSAPMLNPKPRDFSSGVYYIDANADAKTGEAIDLARVIREGPGAFGGSTAMPAWKGTFTEEQVRQLVAFLQSLSERGGRG